MKEISSKRKLQDFALVVNELMITNGYLVEKAKFLKQQSKKIAEILKKNYIVISCKTCYSKFTSKSDFYKLLSISKPKGIKFRSFHIL